MLKSYPLLVFSHLGWHFVFQRPQHLLTRLASERPVFFVEEPVFDPAGPFWETAQPAPNVTVLRPHSPVDESGFSEAQISCLRPMVRELERRHGIEAPIVWLYTPMALPLARDVDPILVVYDCMDELSAFAHAPRGLLEREAELLEWADIVFAGGPSLYRAKKDRHPSVHCFPSSVDAAHFGRARAPLPEPADQAKMARPRLGFFGVIDERLDVDLVAALAAAHPEWSIVMVGPVVKIDPAMLPRADNIHYLGQCEYRDLPSYLAGWDVCLLPFARNEATRFISPTKTLEYMAAEKPIVSTPIRDVADPYGDIVFVADTPEAFVAACERALAENEQKRERRLNGMRRVLSETSWDTTASAMKRLMDSALEARSRELFSAQQAGGPLSEIEEENA